jgi:hypothetical protein
VTVNGAAVPGVTFNARVFTNGSVTEVPGETPHVVGLPIVPAGAVGRPLGHVSVTTPLNVLSGTICN